MKTLFLILICFLFFPFSLHAQMPGMDMSKPASHKNKTPFEISARQTKTFSEEDLSALQAKNKNKIVGDHTIIIDQNDQQMVVTTGPVEDMLSYRIQGLRNPTIAMKPGTRLHIVFMNTDDDMHHDIRIGASQSPWTSSPDIAATVGSQRLDPVVEKKISAEEFTLTANESGSFSYFCSVKGHASGGMRGTVLVGGVVAHIRVVLAQPAIDVVVTHADQKVFQQWLVIFVLCYFDLEPRSRPTLRSDQIPGQAPQVVQLDRLTFIAVRIELDPTLLLQHSAVVPQRIETVA